MTMLSKPTWKPKAQCLPRWDSLGERSIPSRSRTKMSERSNEHPNEKPYDQHPDSRRERSDCRRGHRTVFGAHRSTYLNVCVLRRGSVTLLEVVTTSV